ncbi:efflux transporter outer membrane subunit [Sphingomonas naphthae]|uniref:Efflux transporter outer membrane subunit n=1 Tax=Sphingomonas naphthae TaxID=1813468 RepID=A0ABY7TR81_9SPHN|nr:efflux transporter outer membrane subunit [Sphingomonas naphthae]WCT74334.1 efflux transporter outer membrane subunit [Sphingomonas naphthae]
MSRSHRLSALLGPLLIAGCAAPNLGPKPEIATPGAYPMAQSLAATTPTAAWPEAEWWRAYRDPQLDTLLAEALKGSPSVAIAAARVRQAEGQRLKAGAAGQPQVTGNGSAGLNKQSYNNGIPAQFVPKGWNDVGRLSLDFSLDLDLWGKTRAAVAAATSEAEAARIDAAQAALLLTTDVVAAYADLSRLYAEQDVLKRAFELRSDNARLVSDRVRTGLDTQGELKQSASQVPAARVDLAANEEQIALTRNRIAALVGAGPDRALTIARPVAVVDAGEALPADVGIALVARRPDIAAARARVDAAASRIKVARADFYPNISLSGLIGLQSLYLDNLLKGGSEIGNVGPAISLPIFRGGALKGQYTQARGTYDEAVATYDRTLLTAVREVADAVTSRHQLAAQAVDARAALTDAEGAFRVAQLRYRGGLSTYLNVLSAEQNVLTARRVLAGVEARRLTIDVALVRALGGGFRTAA